MLSTISGVNHRWFLIIAFLATCGLTRSVCGDEPQSLKRVVHYEYGLTVSQGINGPWEHDRPTRVWVEEDDGATTRVLSDKTITYDELGRERIVRDRVVAGNDNNTKDAITCNWYTWGGQVARTVRYGEGSTFDPASPGTGNSATDAIIVNAYDRFDRLTEVAGPGTRKSTYLYDVSGNLTRERVWYGTGVGEYLETVNEYDALNRVTKTTDPEGHYTVRAYDTQSRAIEETVYSSGSVALAKKAWEYDSAGRNTRTVQFASATGTLPADTTADLVADYIYDDGGRVLTKSTYSDAGTAQLTTAYDDIGRLTRRTDPESSTFAAAYRPNSSQQSSNTFGDYGATSSRSVYFTHDTMGRISAETEGTSPARTTLYQYDAMGRRTSMTDAEQIATRYQYDLLGRQVRKTEADGTTEERVTDSIYDRLGNLIGLVAYDGTPETNPPDEWSDLASNNAAQLTRYWFDSAGQRTKVAYPDNTVSDPATDVVQYQYDDAGRLIQMTDQRGLVSGYTYDDRGLVLTKSVSTGGDRKSVFAYDGIGRMTSATVGTAANDDLYADTEFQYDDLSRLTKEIQKADDDAISREIAYLYDEGGNRTRSTFPTDTGVTLEHQYDKLNRVTKIRRDVSGGGFADLATYDYEGQYLATRSASVKSGVSVDLNYTYDAFRRVDSIRNSTTDTGGTELLAGHEFDYDAVDNRTMSIGSGASHANRDFEYLYDDLDRLTQGTDVTVSPYGGIGGGAAYRYRYDLLGNRTEFIYGFSPAWTTPYGDNNAANEYATVDSTTVAYDAAGNLTLDEDGLSYEYDEDNRLTLIYANNDGTAGYASGGTDVAYLGFTYDALGRRVSKVDHGSSTTTYFVYDGQNVVAEYTAGTPSHTLERYFVHGPSYVDERLLLHDSQGTEAGDYIYLLKELYSVSGIVDEDGEPVELYTYKPYGAVYVQSATRRTCGTDGDANGDCDVDLEDFEALQKCFGLSSASAICSASTLAAVDLDDDGDVDADDVEDFGSVHTGPLYLLYNDGDWDDDGTVDEDDYNAFVNTCYGGPGEPISPGSCVVFDLDGDGDVDFDDYGTLLALLGQLAQTQTEIVLAEIDPTASLNPYFFTGRRLDWVDDGSFKHQLQHSRARTYDPEHGRFAQRDPIGYEDGMNGYQYSQNRPSGGLDPSGTRTCWIYHCRRYIDAEPSNKGEKRTKKKDAYKLPDRPPSNPGKPKTSFGIIGHTWLEFGAPGSKSKEIAHYPLAASTRKNLTTHCRLLSVMEGLTARPLGKPPMPCVCMSCKNIKDCVRGHIAYWNANVPFNLNVFSRKDGNNCISAVMNAKAKCCLRDSSTPTLGLDELETWGP